MEPFPPRPIFEEDPYFEKRETYDLAVEDRITALYDLVESGRLSPEALAGGIPENSILDGGTP